MRKDVIAFVVRTPLDLPDLFLTLGITPVEVPNWLDPLPLSFRRPRGIRADDDWGRPRCSHLTAENSGKDLLGLRCEKWKCVGSTNCYLLF